MNGWWLSEARRIGGEIRGFSPKAGTRVSSCRSFWSEKNTRSLPSTAIESLKPLVWLKSGSGFVSNHLVWPKSWSGFASNHLVWLQSGSGFASNHPVWLQSGSVLLQKQYRFWVLYVRKAKTLLPPEGEQGLEVSLATGVAAEASSLRPHFFIPFERLHGQEDAEAEYEWKNEHLHRVESHDEFAAIVQDIEERHDGG